MLNTTTDGLGWADAYSSTIERIKADVGKRRLGVAALMWVSYAQRPLSADELCHALAIEPGAKYFNAGNVPSISTLVVCCQGLIAVDQATSTVRFIRPTVKEYLSTYKSSIFNYPHKEMAGVCSAYPNSEQIKAPSTGPSTVFHNKAFLEYCYEYREFHHQVRFSC